jgi:hypothetical protein
MKFEKTFSTLRTLENVLPKNERHKYSIVDLNTNSFLKLNKELFKVMGKFLYSAGGDKWIELELFSLSTGETKYIEYEIDDTVEIYLTVKSFNVRELAESMDQIEDIADNESGSVIFDNKKFIYDDDYKASFSRTEKGEKEKVYMYEFSDESETTFLTIEEWGNESDGYDYLGFISIKFEASNLEVISL